MSHSGGQPDVTGLSYSEVIDRVKRSLTGNPETDAAYLISIAQSCDSHPRAKEIRRELGRMHYAIAPDAVTSLVNDWSEEYVGGFERGLTEARSRITAGDLAGARQKLESLIEMYGSGGAFYLDDTVSEYRHFANAVELALYQRLYHPTRTVRMLPVDRARLYADYGGLLVEMRDLGPAEEALREAIRLNPVGTDSMFELGEVMKLTHRLSECRGLTLRALAVAYTAPDAARAYRNLGYLAVEDGDFALAVACYGASLAMDPARTQAAQSELFYIQQVTRRTIPSEELVSFQATLARNGVQVGPSDLVKELMGKPSDPDGGRT